MYLQILAALGNVFHLNNILFIILGTFFGIIVGALPGLSSTMGVALLIPITFKMDPAAGLCMLGAIYCGSVYGGSITAILIRTPGTTASIATTWDGYPLTKKGLGGKAIGISTISSFLGGIFSALCLLLIAPPLASFSLNFGPPERFFLAIFGLSIIVTLTSETIVKGLIVAFFGLVIASTGMDQMTGNFRFTFDIVSLFGGIPLLPALIGLYSISQALILIESKSEKIITSNTNITDRILPSLIEFKKVWPTIFRSSIIGTIVGIIPGAGTSIGSFLSYSEAKRTSKHPEEFGKGSIIGVSASEAGNNAVTGGSLVPLLTLGIPGNAVSAVFLGGLMIHGLIAGPALFTKHSLVTYTLILSLFLANIAMLFIGLWWAKYCIKLVNVSENILAPLIIVLSTIGSYAMRNNLFDVYLMFIFGLLGYIMEKFKFPTAPIVLAIVLGPIAESELSRSLAVYHGNIFPIFTRPICIVLIILIIFSFLIPVIRIRKSKKGTISTN